MGFAKKELLEVKDESIKDTLIDMTNYALILYEEYKKEVTLRGVERDFYPTPIEAVHGSSLPKTFRLFAEPCAGDGRLIRHIEELTDFGYLDDRHKPMDRLCW